MSDPALDTLLRLFGPGNAWRTDASLKGGRNTSGLPVGWLDYLVRHSGDHMGHVELKSVKSSKTEKMRPEQIEFADHAEKCGCFVAIVFAECPGQVARAFDKFNGWIHVDESVAYPGRRYSWRANYAANLEEAKAMATRMRKGRTG